jgi:hypothetical protein
VFCRYVARGSLERSGRRWRVEPPETSFVLAAADLRLAAPLLASRFLLPGRTRPGAAVKVRSVFVGSVYCSLLPR